MIAVDPRTAEEVATAFAEAPSMDRSQRTRIAYARLAVEVRSWFSRLTGGPTPPVRVAFTARPEPYRDAAELRRSVRSDRLLEIHSAAYDRQRRHPLLDSSVGSDFDQLRAVHDLVSHGWLGLGFDRDGEYAAWRAEDAHYSAPARAALATELHAQHSVLWTSGQLAELKAVVLPAALIQATRSTRPPTNHQPPGSQS